MTVAAVLLADGFEEIEAVTIIDVLRRAGIEVHVVATNDRDEASGDHGIVVAADMRLADLKDHDAIILPGGYPGAASLRDNDAVIALIREADAAGKLVAAMCAAPIALGRAGVLAGRTYTCYPGVEQQIPDGTPVTDVVVVDGHVITSRGPGTALAFAYALVDALGGDSVTVCDRMLYPLVARDAG